jgi:hypothetical protein
VAVAASRASGRGGVNDPDVIQAMPQPRPRIRTTVRIRMLISARVRSSRRRSCDRASCCVLRLMRRTC